MGRIVRCETCGLVSMVSLEESQLITCSYDASYFYPSPTKVVGYPDYFGREQPLRTKVAACFADAILGSFPSMSSALDVGCGAGYLVEALLRRGVDAWGVDPAHEVIEGASSYVRPRLLHGGVSDQHVVERGPYNLVTAMDVIEHIEHPVAFLRTSWTLLEVAGALVLHTPRYDGRLSKKQGAAYVHFNVDHAYYFTPETLSRCMTQATTCAPLIIETMKFWRDREVRIPSDVEAKYTRERDSIVAVCLKRPVPGPALSPI